MNVRTAQPDSAYRSLIRTRVLLGQITRPYFASHGISGAQWGVLRNLYRAECEGERVLRHADLSSRLIVRPPSVTSLVRRLLKLGLIDQTTSPDDRRTRLLRLTPRGRRLVRKIIQEHERHIQELMSCLNARQRAQLQTLLTRLSAHLESWIAHRDAEGGCVDKSFRGDS
ncbi:MAG: MarR family transcriptional regulator [Planctomycetes bacterium]|nr:MarR family transcriptional regulator [Planctomycetota bacterium]